jgi:ribosomal protein S18 acetylase RimI-like enzyme
MQEQGDLIKPRIAGRSPSLFPYFMINNNPNIIKVEIVAAWDPSEIIDLYRSAGWWKDGMDPSRIGELIQKSFLFAVAIDTSSGKAIGMGRVISDGIADAYIQDLAVLDEWKDKGAGKMILSSLLQECILRRIFWIGLIAEPGTDGFYSSFGFQVMLGHIPMLYSMEWK